MSKKVKVAAIQIQYPDGDVKQVSIEDARELYKQLDDLFGTTYVAPSQPIVIERERWPYWRPYWTHETKPQYLATPPEKPMIYCCDTSE